MLTIKNFSKSYDGERKAVDNISLEILSGDIYGFIGANGAGKTTTIKAVVGILPFTEGEISIDGIDVQSQSTETKKLIAYVPDDPQLYDNLTGAQYLNFIADVFRVPEYERETRVLHYGRELEMLDRLNDPIKAYSHGMKQRLEIISALLHQPQLLILDEPFVGLDPKASFIIKNIMREFCEKGGAIFFSTHVLEVAEKLCNKIAIIKQGQLVASGYMDDVIGDNSLEQVFLELNDHE